MNVWASGFLGSPFYIMVIMSVFVFKFSKNNYNRKMNAYS